MTPAEVLELARSSAVVNLETAARAMSLGRALTYRLAREQPGSLPFRVLRVGSVYRVPTADLVKVLGLDEPDNVGAIEQRGPIARRASNA